MLAFIIPLKSRQVSDSWIGVSQLFERCLKSVCQQSGAEFRVIVVCNERPAISFHHPAVSYLEVDFLPTDLSFPAKGLDKGRRIVEGLVAARDFSPTHIAIVDADDCVSKRLAGFVKQHPESEGWFFDRGYLYKARSPSIYLRRKAFHKRCGTSHILRYSLLKFPQEGAENRLELNQFYNEHQHISTRLEQRGITLQSLPFIGAICIVENGENIYQKSFQQLHHVKLDPISRLKDWRNFRRLTPEICQEFGLYRLEKISAGV
ncbi:glycosyltransferase family 2 protein [Desertifilum sp. FACHB-1129]|uniref:Glycosyltransferase family A protein n=1 Tax=Desertifilum tharense IPPAS B-1220 TaxID=1781255 RepID=A0ACD5H271_9CYAN|nr:MULTISPECIES: glycosyltransferase family A protein [Desertifilum]MBD2311955.1 glycosyltransferase family 2 protein [Desertifilum sp. FACHB-1129]MBD2322407.1 glycosyltransferase family 2 protein [Desertifilum sp. FACHB-866]MBD2332570.1 glycosyltransferase family 2 protein [Desertifilum sp. FACHB-868]MDA0211725.1 glycosyltransferase family A protein [Cyanobacteria bacterium FC1]